MPRSPQPRWVDGAPANLAAAAQDAYEWLLVLRHYVQADWGMPDRAEHRARLARCIAALAEQLGHQTQEPPQRKELPL